MQLKASWRRPRCVLTVCIRLYLAFVASSGLHRLTRFIHMAQGAAEGRQLLCSDSRALRDTDKNRGTEAGVPSAGVCFICGSDEQTRPIMGLFKEFRQQSRLTSIGVLRCVHGHVTRPCPWSSGSSSPYLLDMSTAAPPMRNKQFVISMFFTLPRYMQAVTFSWLMTSARLLGSACTDAHRLTTLAWRLWQGFREEAKADAQSVLQIEPVRRDK